MNVRVSLRMLSAKHSESTAATTEATKILVDSIESLRAAASKANNGNTVVAVITVAEHHRAKRQAEPTDDVSLSIYILNICFAMKCLFF